MPPMVPVPTPRPSDDKNSGVTALLLFISTISEQKISVFVFVKPESLFVCCDN